LKSGFGRSRVENSRQRGKKFNISSLCSTVFQPFFKKFSSNILIWFFF